MGAWLSSASISPVHLAVMGEGAKGRSVRCDVCVLCGVVGLGGPTLLSMGTCGSWRTEKLCTDYDDGLSPN